MRNLHRFSMEVFSVAGLMHQAHNGKLSAIIQELARLCFNQPCIAAECYESWRLRTAVVGRISWVPVPVLIGLQTIEYHSRSGSQGKHQKKFRT